jgi:hypothetical protein
MYKNYTSTQFYYLEPGTTTAKKATHDEAVPVTFYKNDITDPDKDAEMGQIGSYNATKLEMLKKWCGLKDGQEVDNNTDTFAEQLGQKKTVLAVVDIHTLDPPTPAPTKPLDPEQHTVTVTGMEFDANGNLVNVVVNDTGDAAMPSGTANKPLCGKKVPAGQFQSAVMAKDPKTDAPLKAISV